MLLHVLAVPQLEESNGAVAVLFVDEVGSNGQVFRAGYEAAIGILRVGVDFRLNVRPLVPRVNVAALAAIDAVPLESRLVQHVSESERQHDVGVHVQDESCLAQGAKADVNGRAFAKVASAFREEVRGNALYTPFAANGLGEFVVMACYDDESVHMGQVIRQRFCEKVAVVQAADDSFKPCVCIL